MAERVCHKRLEKEMVNYVGAAWKKRAEQRQNIPNSRFCLRQKFVSGNITHRKAGSERTLSHSWKKGQNRAISETMSADPHSERQIINSGTLGSLVSTVVTQMRETRLKPQSEKHRETAKCFQGSQRTTRIPEQVRSASSFPSPISRDAQNSY